MVSRPRHQREKPGTRQCRAPGFGEAWSMTGYLKFAVTVASALSVIVHVVDVPVQAPDQPIHGCPASGFAVSVIVVPEANDVPAMLCVTVPLPVVRTVSFTVVGVVVVPPPVTVPPPPVAVPQIGRAHV